MSKPTPFGMEERLRRIAQQVAAIDGRGRGQRVEIGHVDLFVGADVPMGWLKMDGSMASTDDFPLLWFKIGTTFGATATTGGVLMFKLPTMAAPANFVYGIRAVN